MITLKYSEVVTLPEPWVPKMPIKKTRGFVKDYCRQIWDLEPLGLNGSTAPEVVCWTIVFSLQARGLDACVAGDIFLSGAEVLVDPDKRFQSSRGTVWDLEPGLRQRCLNEGIKSVAIPKFGEWSSVRETILKEFIGTEIKVWLGDSWVIHSFRGEYYFLSNMSPYPVVYEGVEYPTVENAFQAAKTVAANRGAFVNVSPVAAKKLGRRVPLRKDWEEVKVGIMRELLRQKFAKKPVRGLLAKTRGMILVEGNTWGDRFWGFTTRGGKNMLGKLLTEIRDTLTVTFTGRRPQGLPGGWGSVNANEKMIKEKLEVVLRDLVNKHEKVNFISGMALGVDTWAAEVVLALRDQGANVTLTCAIPCLGYANNWNKTSRTRFQGIVNRADEVVNVTEEPYRVECLTLRNHWMLDRSDLLVAIWEGDRKGGTWEAISYANKRGTKVKVIAPR